MSFVAASQSGVGAGKVAVDGVACAVVSPSWRLAVSRPVLRWPSRSSAHTVQVHGQTPHQPPGVVVQVVLVGQADGVEQHLVPGDEPGQRLAVVLRVLDRDATLRRVEGDRDPARVEPQRARAAAYR